MISNAYRHLLHDGRLISERLTFGTSSGGSPAHRLCPGAVDSTWRKGHLGLTDMAPETVTELLGCQGAVHTDLRR